MRNDWPDLRVAITGASSGIGEAAARELASRGASLALCARRTDRLKRLAADCRRRGARRVVFARADVSKWADVAAFARRSRKEIGDVDVVIANAGYGNLGNSLDLPPEEVARIFATNTVGAIWTVQAFADQLERRRGHAIVVGSVVSKVAIPYGSIYSATKWALRGWTRGARPELESRHIALTLFDPGYVKTEFFQSRVQGKGVQGWHSDRGMTAAQVARRLVRAIRRRPAEMEMTLLSRVAIPLYRLMPIQAPRIVARLIRDRADARRAQARP